MILAFKIGEKWSGRANQGSRRFIGEHKIGEFIDDYNLYLNEEEGEYYDDGGNSVGLTSAEVESGVGSIDYDGQYNTTYTTEINTYSDVKDEQQRGVLLRKGLTAAEWNAILWSESWQQEEVKKELNITENY